MPDDRRLIEDFLPAVTGKTAQAGIVAVRLYEIPAEAIQQAAKGNR